MNFHSSLILFLRLCFCYIEASWRYNAWNLLMHRVSLFSYHIAHLLKCPKWIYVKWRKFCNFNANTFSSKTQQNLNNQKVLQMYFLLLDDSKLNLLHKSGISRNYSILLYDIYPPNFTTFTNFIYTFLNLNIIYLQDRRYLQLEWRRGWHLFFWNEDACQTVQKREKRKILHEGSSIPIIFFTIYSFMKLLKVE